MLIFLVVVVVAVSMLKGDINIDCGGGVDNGRYGDGDGVDQTDY